MAGWIQGLGVDVKLMLEPGGQHNGSGTTWPFSALIELASGRHRTLTAAPYGGAVPQRPLEVMMVFTLFKRHSRTAAVLALAAAITLALLTLTALGGRGPTAARAAVKHATSHAATAHDPDTLQVGDQTSPDPTGSAAKAAAANDPAGNSQAGGPDTSGANDPAGNSQAGGPDNTGASDPAGNSQAGGPDNAGASDPAGNSQAGGPDTSSTSGESSVDSEHGLPGEPAAGHADPAGSAGSDCTGNCVQ